MRTHQVTTCPSCGGSDSEEIRLGDSHTLHRCRTCDLVCAPEFADPEEIYVDGYLTGDVGDFGLDVFNPVFQEFLTYAAHRRLEWIETQTPVGRLLDVGCGSGEVLAAAQDRGWTGAGAEPVEHSATVAQERGLDVRSALLEDSGLERGAWDVVSAFHVLEHMSDGAGFLTSIARWAKPGGHVVVEVPNWDSFHRERLAASWPGLRPLEHIAHYGPDTLRGVMERAGLEVVEVRTMGFLWERQTLNQQLADLAHGKWRPLLSPLCRTEQRDGQSVKRPGRLVGGLLRGVQASYDRRRKGQVVQAIARVPR